MATLRDYVNKISDGFVSLSTSQSVEVDTNEFSEQTDLVNSATQLRLIPHGAYATTQSLLKVTQDLIYNDRAINNEVSASHSLLCDGMFNDPDNNFELELTYEENKFNNIKTIELGTGKIKTQGLIFQTTGNILFTFDDDVIEYDVDDDVTIKRIIPRITNEDFKYRRDYISVVYSDTSVENSGKTPYIRYAIGEETSSPDAKHYQKYYETDISDDSYNYDEWDETVLDSSGDQAVYKEFILYSLLIEYNQDGDWSKIEEASILPDVSGYSDGDYIVIQAYVDYVYTEQLFKVVSGAWSQVTNINYQEIDYFPPTSSIENYPIHLTSVVGSLDIGWYYKIPANSFTELDTVDLVAQLSGISELVNFENAVMNIYDDNGFTILKTSSQDKPYYHPYSNFQPLEFVYGQGRSSTIEGLSYDPDDNFVLNTLNSEYVGLANENSLLYNFPFIIDKYSSLNEVIDDTATLDHVMLGYKKDGFWNNDFVKNTINGKFYRIVDNAWVEFTPSFETSFIPFNAEYEYLRIGSTPATSTIYKKVDEVWEAQGSYKAYESLDITAPSYGDIVYVTSDETNPKGWYIYTSFNVWDKITVNTSNALIYEDLFDDDTYIYCDGSYNDAEGIYKYSQEAWESVVYSVVEVEEYSQEELEQNVSDPYANQYVKAKIAEQGSDDDEYIFYKYLNGSWITIDADMIETASDTDFPLDADSGSFAEISTSVTVVDLPIDTTVPTDQTDGYGDYFLFREEDDGSDGDYVYSEIYHWNGTSYDTLTSDLQVGEELPNITSALETGSYIFVSNDEDSILYQFTKNVNGATFDDHGKYWKSTNEGDTTKPSYGWYKYDYFNQTWEKIFVKYGSNFPSINLTDKLYYQDESGDLYIYDLSNSYWEELTFDEGSVKPESPSVNDCFYVNTFETTEKFGFYVYNGNSFSSETFSTTSGLPALEDNIEIQIVKAGIFKTSEGVSEVDVTFAELTETGTYKILISELRSNLSYVNNSPANAPQADDCVYISDGNGKYQTGVISELLTEDGTTYIVATGLLNAIDTTSSIIFFKATDFTIIDTSQLSKNDIMDQIDAIDSFVAEANTSTDESVSATKFNEANNLYEIKFSLNNPSISKNSLYLIMTKSYKEDSSYLSPQIVIGNSETLTTERNGYYKVRVLTDEGNYPYYGTDYFGNDDTDLEYLVLKDTYGEIETDSTARNSVIGVTSFNVIATALDDVSAEQLYNKLSGETQINNIYFDVFYGRLMIHPTLVPYINDGSYEITLSHIYLNTLTGSVTTDNIIHEKNDKKYFLSDVMAEQEEKITNFSLAVDNRRIFKYRTKAFNPVYLSTKKAKLLSDVIEDETVYFCFEDGTKIDDIKYLEGEFQYPRATYGDSFSLNLMKYNKGFYRANDIYKNNVNQLSQYIDGAWTIVPYSSGSTFPTSPSTDDFFELIDNDELYSDDGMYKYDGSSWIKKTNYAFYTDNTKIPTVKYSKTPITLSQDYETFSKTALSFTVPEEISKQQHKMVGIRLDSLGTVWNSGNIIVRLFNGADDLIGSATKSYDEVDAIINDSIDFVDQYLYFEIDAELSGNINYYYTVNIDSTASSYPELLGYYNNGTYGFFKTYMLSEALTYDEANYPDNNIFNILHSSGYELEGCCLTEEPTTYVDSLTNKPLIELESNTLIVPVDFSNDTVFDEWNYASCIGVDIITGRVKFPDKYDITNFTFEFNANWSLIGLSAKGINLSSNKNVSAEDYFDIINKSVDHEDFMAYVDERIARYSPKQDTFYLNGNSGQTFTLSFTPAGYSTDDEGNLIEVDGSYFGSDAVKSALLVRLNQALLNPSDFEIHGREVVLNDTIERVSGDILIVRGAEYRVISTVADKSITPDHFSNETQALMQELLNIKADIPDEIEELKSYMEAYVDYKYDEKVLPKENIFRVEDGNIEQYLEASDTWSSLKANDDILPLTWNPNSKLDLFVFVNNVPQSSRTYQIINENEVNIIEGLAEDDYIIIRGNYSISQYNPTDFIVPHKQVIDDLIEDTNIIECENVFPSEEFINIFVNGLFYHNFTMSNNEYVNIFGYQNLYDEDLYVTPVVENYGMVYDSSDEEVTTFEEPIIYGDKLYFAGEIGGVKKLFFSENDAITEISTVVESDDELIGFSNFVVFGTKIYFEGETAIDKKAYYIEDDVVYYADTIVESDFEVLNFSSPVVFDGKLFFEGELDGVKKAYYFDETFILNYVDTSFGLYDVFEFDNAIVFDERLYFKGLWDSVYQPFYISISTDESDVDTITVSIADISSVVYTNGFSNPIIFNEQIFFEGNTATETNTFTINSSNVLDNFSDESFSNPIVNNSNCYFKSEDGTVKYIDGNEITYSPTNTVNYLDAFENPVANKHLFFQGQDSLNNKHVYYIAENNVIKELSDIADYNTMITNNSNVTYFDTDFFEVFNSFVLNHAFDISISGDTTKTIVLTGTYYKYGEDFMADLIVLINTAIEAQGLENEVYAQEGVIQNSIMLVSESAENVEIMVTTYESDESDELIYEDALDTFDMTVSLYTKLNQSCYVNLADTVGVGDTIVITSGVIRGQYILDGAIETEHLSTDLKDSLGIA